MVVKQNQQLTVAGSSSTMVTGHASNATQTDGGTTTKGLRVRAALDTNAYPTGVKVEDATMAALRLIPDKFHGDWNYTIAPQDSGKINKQPRRLRVKLQK